MILVVSYPEDPHATRVIAHLQRAQENVLLFDLADLPRLATITFDYTDGPRPGLEYICRGVPLDLTTVRAIWWRRPRAADVSSIADPNAQLFTANEWNEAINGLWQLLNHARWINDPVRDDVASRKAYQLRVAAEMGLRIPRTLITSDPDRGREFIQTEGIGRTIFKTFSCTHEVWRETRLVRQEDLEILDSVRLAPVIFQEYVPADVDLRITTVGDRVSCE